MIPFKRTHPFSVGQIKRKNSGGGSLKRHSFDGPSRAKKILGLMMFLLLGVVIGYFFEKACFAGEKGGRRTLVADLEWRTVPKRVFSQWAEATIDEGQEIKSRCLVNNTVEGISDGGLEEKVSDASFVFCHRQLNAFKNILSALDHQVSEWFLLWGHPSVSRNSTKITTRQAGEGRSDYVDREILVDSVPFRMSSSRKGGVAENGTELMLDYSVPPQLKNNICISLNMRTFKGDPVLVLLGDYFRTLEVQSIYAPNSIAVAEEKDLGLNQGGSAKEFEWRRWEKGKIHVFEGRMDLRVDNMTHMDILGAPTLSDLRCSLDLEVNGKPIELQYKMSEILRINFHNHSTFRLGIRDVLQRKFGVIQRADLHGVRIVLLKDGGESTGDPRDLLGVNVLVPWLARSHPGGKSRFLFTGGLTLSGNSEPPYRETANWDELRRVGLDINNDLNGEIVVTRSADVLATKPEIIRLFLGGWGEKPVIAVAENLSRMLQKWGGLYFYDAAFRHEVIVPYVDFLLPNPKTWGEPLVFYFNANKDKGENSFSVQMDPSERSGRLVHSFGGIHKPIASEVSASDTGSNASELVSSFESNQSFPVGKSEFFYWGIPQDIEGLVTADIQVEGAGGRWEKRVFPNKRIPVPDWLRTVTNWKLRVSINDAGVNDQINSLGSKAILESIRGGEIVFYRAEKIRENSAILWPRPQFVVDSIKMDLINPALTQKSARKKADTKRRVLPQEMSFRSVLPNYLFSESLDLEYSLPTENRILGGCWLRADFVTEKRRYERVICTESNFGKINIPIFSLRLGGNKGATGERITHIDWHIQSGGNNAVNSSLLKVFFRNVRNVSPLEESTYFPVAAVDHRLFYADLKSVFNRGNIFALDAPLSESPTDFSRKGEYLLNIWEDVHPLLIVKKIGLSPLDTRVEPLALPSVGRQMIQSKFSSLLAFLFPSAILLVFLFYSRNLILRVVKGAIEYSQLCPPYFGFYVGGVVLLLLFIGYFFRKEGVGDFLFSVASLLSSYGLWLVSKGGGALSGKIVGLHRMSWFERLPMFGWMLTSIFLLGALLLTLHIHRGGEMVIDVGYYLSVFYVIRLLAGDRRNEHGPCLTSGVVSE